MAEKKQVYSCHKTSYPDSSFFLPAMSPLSTLILMEYSLRQKSFLPLRLTPSVLILILMEYSLRHGEQIIASCVPLSRLNPYSNGI